MFLLVPACLGSPGRKAVKRLCVCVAGYLAPIIDQSIIGAPLLSSISNAKEFDGVNFCT